MVKPKVTPAFADVPTSNDWWSSLIWQFDRGGQANPYSEPLFAHPLSLKALPEGLGIGGPGTPQVASRTYFFPYVQDLRVGLDGLTAPATRVSGYGDWTVTAEWRAGDRQLTATFGHGLPFAYFEASGGPALIDLDRGGRGRGLRREPGQPGPHGGRPPLRPLRPHRRHLDPRARQPARPQRPARPRHPGCLFGRHPPRRPSGHLGPFSPPRLRLRDRHARGLAIRRRPGRPAHHLHGDHRRRIRLPPPRPRPCWRSTPTSGRTSAATPAPPPTTPRAGH